MVIHYEPKPIHQQPCTPFAHIVWLIHLPGKVIDLLLSDPFPPERCQRALISQTPCLCFSVTWLGSCLPFSGLEGAAPQLSHCLAWGDGFRSSWHNLCLSGKASASSFVFWTELSTPCNLGDNPESPEGGIIPTVIWRICGEREQLHPTFWADVPLPTSPPHLQFNAD